MTQITHTKGPFYGGLQISGSRGKIIAKVQANNGPTGYKDHNAPHEQEAGANAFLIARFDEVPHTCADPTCPGVINQRKTRAFDGLLEATRSARNALSKGGAMDETDRIAWQDCDNAIARAEWRG